MKMPETIKMSKLILRKHVGQIGLDVAELFSNKNEQYGSEDALMNFREMMPTIRLATDTTKSDLECMYIANEVLADKHRVTMLSKGLSDPNFEERCLDRICYLSIALAMHREMIAAGKRGEIGLVVDPSCNSPNLQGDLLK